MNQRKFSKISNILVKIQHYITLLKTVNHYYFLNLRNNKNRKVAPDEVTKRKTDCI